MGDEFTASEISEAVTLARIYSPGYTEEQFRASAALVERLKDSGYLEAVSSIAKLEKEKGTHFTDVLDACRRLLKEKSILEQKLSDLKTEIKDAQVKLTQEQGELHQLEEAIGRAKAERKKGARELTAFRKKADREKESIDKEIEEYRVRASLTEQEVDMASRLKAELDRHSLALDLVLGLAQEFAGYEDSRDELIKRLEEYGSLSKSIGALEADLIELKSHRDEDQKMVDSLEQNHRQLESAVCQLQADIAHEEELRRFYRRYQGISPLMDYLAAWNQIYFVRCNNPVFIVTGAFSKAAGNAHFCTDKLPIKCPHCGCGANLLVYDESPYYSLGIPAGTPVKLQLGE
jgi:peptidoglycan hydrolase CwlO-like protein